MIRGIFFAFFTTAIVISVACSNNKSLNNRSIPNAPEDLVGQATSSSVIRLSWVDQSSNETGFIVFRGQDGLYLPVDTVGRDEVLFWDVGLQDSTTYAYYIVAANSLGNSANSNMAIATTWHSTSAPFTPMNPTPADDSRIGGTSLRLRWHCSDPNGDGLIYSVCFGKESPPVLVAAEHYPQSYDPGPLELNTTYYWRIIARDDQLNQTIGPIWRFATSVTPNEPPSLPANPLPLDGMEEVPLEAQLNWQCSDTEGDFLAYDIYFGPEDPPPFVRSQYMPIFDPSGDLEPYTTYYWRVIAHDSFNQTEGPRWKFTTGPEPKLISRLKTQDPVFDVWITSSYVYVAGPDYFFTSEPWR